MNPDQKHRLRQIESLFKGVLDIRTLNWVRSIRIGKPGKPEPELMYVGSELNWRGGEATPTYVANHHPNRHPEGYKYPGATTGIYRMK